MSEGNASAPAPAGQDSQQQTQNAESKDQKTATGTAKGAEPVSGDKGKTAGAETPPASAGQDRKFKLKINGSEVEVSENALVAAAQKGMAADEKFRKAAERSKYIENLAALAKSDPDRLIQELTGQDPLEVYKAKLKSKLELLTMDPKERELYEAKQKIAEFEKERQARIEQEKKNELDRTTKFYIEKFDRELPEAIKQAGLPLTQDVIRMTAETMYANLEEGLDLPYELIMEDVKERYRKSFGGFSKATPAEALIDLLGEDVIQAAAKALQAKGAKSQQKQGQSVVATDQKKDEKPNNYMTKDELAEYVKNWVNK